MEQAAGVKRLLFCGVGCQVQGIDCVMISNFLLLVLLCGDLFHCDAA